METVTFLKRITLLEPEEYQKITQECFFGYKPKRREIHYFDTPARDLSLKNFFLLVDKRESLFLKLKERRKGSRRNLIEEEIGQREFMLLRSLNTEFHPRLHTFLQKNNALNRIISLGNIYIQEVAIQKDNGLWLLNETSYPGGEIEHTLVFSSANKSSDFIFQDFLEKQGLNYAPPQRSRKDMFFQ